MASAATGPRRGDEIHEETERTTIITSPFWIACTITAGQSSVTFDITVTDDAIEDGDETVTVDASAPAHTPGSETITIRDDDGPLPIVRWSSAAQTVSETDGTATVTVTMTATAATDIVVPFTLSGSATGGGVDYQVGATDITIPSGDTTADPVVALGQAARQ